MSSISLPKNALERIKIGQAFAEYDLIRDDPDLFVSTPSTIAALNSDGQSCFFVGRRGAGKTAIVYEIQRRLKRTISITPQIFDLLELPLDHEEFRDTRQRPFKSLMHTMERALLDEIIRTWIGDRIFDFKGAPTTIGKERNLIEDCDFDQRVISLTGEIFDAYSKKQDKLWLRQINRSKELISEVNQINQNGNFKYTILIDRLDESWDGSESAMICLMALMHAAVRLNASTSSVRPYIFIRENIYDRIRSMDNEFSRLETSVIFLDWSERKLQELVERRLVRPFVSKPKLGGDAWNCFFEEIDGKSSVSKVMNFCQHRPRDVLMLISYAIDAAIANGNQKVSQADLEDASKRYSTSRLKDLGDEFSENYPNISIILEHFYGLGSEFTLVAIEDFIGKLLVNEKIRKYCGSWFYDYTVPFRFVELLYGIGFLGLSKKSKIAYKESGKDANAKLAIDATVHFVIHPTYQPALNIRPILVQRLDDETTLRNEGLLEDLPENYQFDQYKNALNETLSALKALGTGYSGAGKFEDLVGEVIKLCFFRSLTNIQPKVRTHDGSTIRDWVASNRAANGFWEVIRTKYGATQIVWECKNYEELHADDFHQVSHYFSNTFGKFGVIAFRGSEIKDSYIKHIANVANKNQVGFILPITQKDLEVFLRQAINGAFKEAHIQDRYDHFVRQVS
ncbi:P-loop ATPase, Sll1717 family [Ralstonia pseudosolanacearum]|uniref:Putative transposon gamma-delta 80.3 kDa protein (Transposon rotein TnpX) n=1 Tax=Ralstonia solanacearum TaxID=305 RepID=A0A0S4UAF7_RALSL|nr:MULTISPECIES: transposase [Ralstonia]NKA56074.1 transposase [Ralstonia solanacearum]MCK4130097.1 transposase [Ralstonia pseudosolanacearum]NKA67773.1 transposase [Ralstonia solanacearum]NKA71058.1 transposase [Ralstonia solanacearum]NKA85771.1 transposase [Ralstonia solanacearum]